MIPLIQPGQGRSAKSMRDSAIICCAAAIIYVLITVFAASGASREKGFEDLGAPPFPPAPSASAASLDYPPQPAGGRRIYVPPPILHSTGAPGAHPIPRPHYPGAPFGFFPLREASAEVTGRPASPFVGDQKMQCCDSGHPPLVYQDRKDYVTRFWPGCPICLTQVAKIATSEEFDRVSVEAAQFKARLHEEKLRNGELVKQVNILERRDVEINDNLLTACEFLMDQRNAAYSMLHKAGRDDDYKAVANAIADAQAQRSSQNS